ncbi:uncharacterized protein LOC128192294 isoform X2 [Crassostrea angulata]|uniref:uncharacterized protein LOC128192294 isoform X2 n=1 Tax=Magallana angulata TaxID=2784310 RepID=UPI0022B1A660|nr:uncharacterized protein LOC128192294 isoform X2 [Crassostrea angulata]
MREVGLYVLFLVLGHIQAEQNDSCRFRTLAPLHNQSSISPILEKHESALLMILGFAGFSIVLAIIHNSIRKYIYKDAHSLDTVFDAGGKVTLSLTAVTVTSQLLWPADFLQITTITITSGIGGCLFFVLGIVLDILLFPILSVELKTKAPGAKTFLQIIYTRYGKPAHVVFCCIALFANIVTITALLVAGKSAISVLTKDASDEFIAFVLAVLFGSYCFLGGLGTTFYISYFNTAITFVGLIAIVVSIAYTDNINESMSKYVSIDAMYDAMSCIKSTEGNYEDSLLTFRTRSGAIYGLSLFFMATSLSFIDQANWQSRIAAKPVQGVIGFFIAAIMFFCLPATIALPATLTYASMAYENGTHFLSQNEIVNGFITPFVLEKIMGSTGAYLLITSITMALMSTGSGEVMAVSSIVVYDIYKVYINPFRRLLTPTSCILCGLQKVGGKHEVCSCPTSAECIDCSKDMKRKSKTRDFAVQYTCPIHGDYRHYEDLLMHHKSWCIVWVTISVIPYALVVYASNINLTWVIFFMQGTISPFAIPLLLAIIWSRCTSSGVITGCVVGLIGCVAANFVVSEVVYEGGLSNFFINTIQDYSLLAGCVAGISLSSVCTIVTSLLTNKIKTEEDVAHEWDKTISINNPLNPWQRLYEEELAQFPPGTKPTAAIMGQIFRSARNVAVYGGLSFVFLFLVVVPAVVLSFGVLTREQFSSYLTFSYVICFLAAVFVVIAPPTEEMYQIVKTWKSSRNTEIQKEKVPKTELSRL